jgi:hypothetical protein
MAAAYKVKFFKNLVSSDGHPFVVLQRVVTVGPSENTDSAVRIAKMQFERSEKVVDWRLHADFVEATTDDETV